MHLKFCGAAQQVTGSAHLITLNDGFKILLDCGLYQGRRKDMEDFNEKWLFDPTEINCVILSHAHIDHSGRLPKLVKDGFKGNIFSTHATRNLCAIMLLDSAKIQERDAAYHNKKVLKRRKKKKKNKGVLPPLREPLYESVDAARTMEQFVSCSYERWFRIHPNVKVLFRDAGHILGSATVTLQVEENGKVTRLGFTGDIGRPDRPILRDPQPMPEVDFLISESTYGDKDHDEKPAEMERFLKIINETCVTNKGKLIIPAFSVGRTQEIVYMLDQFESNGVLPRIPVFVDSPLAVNATMVFGSHPECFDDDLNEYMLIDDNPFGFNNLTYVRSVERSKELNDFQEACIIISASGMMNAGRIRHHLFNSLEGPQNTLLIVGYCTPYSTGGILRSGVEQIKLFGEWLNVRANVEIMDSFSAHGDRNEMKAFLQNQKNGLRNLFLVHGDLERQQAFKKLLNDDGFDNVDIPALGDEMILTL